MKLTTPVNFGIYRLYQKTNETFGFLAFWKSGYSQIRYLKQRNEELAVAGQNAKDLKSENAILKSQFRETPELAASLLPAGVVGFERYLLLDKGAKEGVKAGQTVLYKQLLVGKINKVFDHQSQVLLLTDPSAKITVISTKNKSKGVLEGTFGTGLTLTHVVSADSLEPEETLETWGGQDYPERFLAGKILEIAKKESELFKTAKVAPLVDYNKLTTVFVLLN